MAQSDPPPPIMNPAWAQTIVYHAFITKRPIEMLWALARTDDDFKRVLEAGVHNGMRREMDWRQGPQLFARLFFRDQIKGTYDEVCRTGQKLWGAVYMAYAAILIPYFVIRTGRL